MQPGEAAIPSAYNATMSPQEFRDQWRDLFLGYAPLILIIGISGIIIIVGLMWAWRNHVRRQRILEKRRASRAVSSPHVDAWQSAADRVEEPGSERPPGFPFTDDESDEPDEPGGTWKDSYEDGDGYADDEENDDDDEPPPWS